MKKKARKLSLNKETIRILEEGHLKEVAGATATDCGYTYCSNCASCPATCP
jgi:heterodisulfide reductase subunit C